MQLSLTAALLACTSSVYAFSDSSPFILLSTAKLATTPNQNLQLQTSTQVIQSAKDVLSSCPTDRYLVVSIPNLHAADIRSASTFKLPNLLRAIAEKNLRDDFTVAEVIGQISTTPLEEIIQTTCQAKGRQSKVEMVELKHLPSLDPKDVEKRMDILADNDHQLGRLLDAIDGQFTIIILSDPNEFKAYEPDFVDAVHMDLKRAVEEGASSFVGRRADNETERDNRPLFEKYQFFTPGIFMAIFSIIIILSILGAGISALSSLQVSYGAFDKEMGPAAQKKSM